MWEYRGPPMKLDVWHISNLWFWWYAGKYYFFRCEVFRCEWKDIRRALNSWLRLKEGFHVAYIFSVFSCVDVKIILFELSIKKTQHVKNPRIWQQSLCSVAVTVSHKKVTQRKLTPIQSPLANVWQHKVVICPSAQPCRGLNQCFLIQGQKKF